MANVPSVPICRSLKGSCTHSFVIHHLSAGEKISRTYITIHTSCERSLYPGGGGGLPARGLYEHRHDVFQMIFFHNCIMKKLIIKLLYYS